MALQRAAAGAIEFAAQSILVSCASRALDKLRGCQHALAATHLRAYSWATANKDGACIWGRANCNLPVLGDPHRPTSWITAWRGISTTPCGSQAAGGGGGPAHRHIDNFDRHHRVNDRIFSRALRVLMPDGSNAIMSRREALKAASERNMDLVEIKAPLHGVGAGAQELPVAKIVSYGKLRAQRQQAVHELHAFLRSQQQPTQQPTEASDASAVASGIEGRSAVHGGAANSLQQQPQQQQRGSSTENHARKQQASSHAPGSIQTTSKGTENHARKQQASSHAPGSIQTTSKGTKGAKGASVHLVGMAAKPPKEVFFSPHIAQHDVQVRLRRVRAWLQQGRSVSMSQEVGSTGDAAAASRALDSYIQAVADLGTPKSERKTLRSNLASTLILPRTQQEVKPDLQSHEHGHKKQRDKGRSTA